MAQRTKLSLTACILAGGKSSRMRRDKSKLRLGRKTLLGLVRVAAKDVAHPVKVIRHDIIPSCGPLSGLYTALKATSAKTLLFLSCDMPFVTPRFLKRLQRALQPSSNAVFSWSERGASFPFILRKETLGVVEHLVRQGNRSLQDLAQALMASYIRPKRGESTVLFNINTPSDWARAREIWLNRAPD